MPLRIVIIIALLSFAIMSCKSTVSKESAGKIIGAIQGAAIGTQIGKGKGKLVAIAAVTVQ